MEQQRIIARVLDWCPGLVGPGSFRRCCPVNTPLSTNSSCCTQEHNIETTTTGSVHEGRDDLFDTQLARTSLDSRVPINSRRVH